MLFLHNRRVDSFFVAENRELPTYQLSVRTRQSTHLDLLEDTVYRVGLLQLSLFLIGLPILSILSVTGGTIGSLCFKLSVASAGPPCDSSAHVEN